MRRVLALMAAAWLAAAGAAHAAPLRIAAVGKGEAGCRSLGMGASLAERTYYDHLAKRLGVEVQKCLVADSAAAAAALSAGTVDIALLDPTAFAPVKATTRALLTVRSNRDSNRIPVILAVRASDPRRTLAALKGATVAFGGKTSAGLATPRAVLAERGAPAGFVREVVENDGELAIQHLRDGKVDAVAVHAAAWQRVCRMVTPKAPNPCRDLHMIFKARPRAAHALVVRRDIPLELRYRLIGIHLPLHLEAPAAFAFAAAFAPGAAEFQPAEAEALTLANIK